MISAFHNGLDIHRQTAAQVIGKHYDSVTSSERSAAKAVNFGIVYGISAYSLSDDLHISVKEAQDYIDGYFAQYPNVRSLIETLVDTAKTNGYAATMFGRRRMLPELNSSNFNTRAFGERCAVNMPIQGTAADIIKIAMVRINEKLKGMESRLILQVHDEVLLEVKPNEKETVYNLVKHEMENAAELNVKLSVDLMFGENWLNLK
jgi:DNA polymerase-1